MRGRIRKAGMTETIATNLIGLDTLHWLEARGGCFCLVTRWDSKGNSPGKRCFEDDWPDKPYTVEQVKKHFIAGGNVGLLCGVHSGGLHLLDADEDFSQFCEYFPWAKTTPAIVRDGPDKGKLIIRIAGDLPPEPKKFKHEPIDKSPFFEFLATGNMGVVAGINPAGKDIVYRLINSGQEIPIFTVADINDICKIWCDEGLDDSTTHQAPEAMPAYDQPEHQNGDNLLESVLAVWSTTRIFEHFNRVGKTRMESKGEWLRLYGNGGLFLHCENGQPDNGWAIPGEKIGGGPFQAWWYCKYGNAHTPKGHAFYELMCEMANVAGIPIPEPTHQADPEVAHARETPPQPEALPIEGTTAEKPYNKPSYIHDASDVFLPRPPRIWVMDQLILERSLNLWVGKFGSKKTWSILSAAVCIALKKPWLLFEVPKAVKVLYIDQDMGEDYTQEYLEKCIRGEVGQDFITGKLSYISGAGYDLFNPDTVNRLSIDILNTGAELVFMDALRNFTPGRDENSVKEMQPALNTLRQLTFLTKAAFVVSHHENRAGEWSGSTAIPGGVDSMLSIKSEEGNPFINFKTGKKRSGKPQEFAAKGVWSEDDSQFYLVEVDANSIKPVSQKALDVLDFFDDGDKPFPTLQAHFDLIGKTTLYSIVGDWVKKKKLERKNQDAATGQPAVYGKVML
jgi:hypothetical protein